MTDEGLVKKCLLTEEDEIAIVESCPYSDRLWYKHDHALCQAQLTKAIPIIRKAVEEECLQDKIEYGVSTYESGYAMTKQEVAEKIKRELEKIAIKDSNGKYYWEGTWQSFWERQGVK